MESISHENRHGDSGFDELLDLNQRILSPDAAAREYALLQLSDFLADPRFSPASRRVALLKLADLWEALDNPSRRLLLGVIHRHIAQFESLEPVHMEASVDRLGRVLTSNDVWARALTLQALQMLAAPLKRMSLAPSLRDIQTWTRAARASTSALERQAAVHPTRQRSSGATSTTASSPAIGDRFQADSVADQSAAVPMLRDGHRILTARGCPQRRRGADAPDGPTQRQRLEQLRVHFMASPSACSAERMASLVVFLRRARGLYRRAAAETLLAASPHFQPAWFDRADWPDLFDWLSRQIGPTWNGVRTLELLLRWVPPLVACGRIQAHYIADTKALCDRVYWVSRDVLLVYVGAADSPRSRDPTTTGTAGPSDRDERPSASPPGDDRGFVAAEPPDRAQFAARLIQLIRAVKAPPDVATWEALLFELTVKSAHPMFFLVRLGQTDAAFSTSVSCRRLRALWRVHEVVSDPVFSGLDLAKRVPDLDPDVASHLTRSLVYTSSERPPPPDQHDVFFQRAARSVALWKERASSDAFVAWHVYQMIPRLLADRHFALVTALVANDVVPALSSDWSHDWMSCLRHVCCAEEALEQLLRHEAASDLSYWAANPDVLTAVDLEVLAPWAHAISSASVASSRVAPKPRSPHLRRCDDRISGSGDTPVAIAWLVARRDLFTTAMAALRLPCVNVHSMSSVQRVTWHSMTQRMNGLIAAFQALSAQYREMGTLPPFDHASDQALCTWWATTAADFAAALQQRVVYLAPERGSPSLSAASRKPETSLVHRVVHAFQSLPPLPLCFLLH